MREFLVATFLCGDCGSKLELAEAEDQKKERYDGKHDGITGANKVEMAVTIEPCTHCKKEYSKAAGILKSIAKYGEVRG